MSAALLPALPDDMESWSARGPRPSVLIQRHRTTLTHVLLLGGTDERRLAVARAFHDHSPLGRGAFVRVDARASDEALSQCLHAWLGDAAPDPAATDPVRDSARGTLFIDHVAALDAVAQRRLLRFVAAVDGGRTPQWAGRFIVGAPAALEEEVSGGRFLADLLDTLDRIRIELRSSPPHGGA
jgi:DNA-binding NtrC family response regulator